MFHLASHRVVAVISVITLPLSLSRLGGLRAGPSLMMRLHIYCKFIPNEINFI